MKIRAEQLEVLAAAVVDDARRRKLYELRDRGYRVEQDPKGMVLVTDKADNTVKVEPLGLKTRVTSAEGSTTEFEQYPYGRIKRIVDPAGREVRFERDNEGFLKSIDRGPGGGRFGFELSKKWQPLRVDYPDGTTTRNEYTEAGEQSRIINRDGSEIRYEYDEAGLLSAIVDPKGGRTTIAHTGPGESRVLIFPDGARHEYVDDPGGGPQRFLVNGEPHAEYRVENGAVVVEYRDGTRERFVFEEGRLVEAKNESATVHFAYDDVGRLLSEEVNGQVVQYQRNAAGSLTAIVTPKGEVLEFVRDRDQRLKEVVDWNGGRYQIDLPTSGPPTAIVYPNGVRLAASASSMGLPASWTVVGSDGEAIDEASWAYDLCDRLIASERQFVRREYQYDKAGRLTNARGPNPETSERFSLDACGNRTEGVHDAANRLIRFRSRTFAYDGLGNTIADSDGGSPRRYRYDGRGRLIAVELDGKTVRYSYDPLGRRIAKTVDNVTTRFEWAGTQLLAETIGDGEQAVRRDYLTCPEFLAPLAFRDGDLLYRIHAGRRQEPLCVTDDAGQVAWQAEYQVFGQAQILVDRVRMPLRLPGQYRDDETGLHYSVARYYDPEIGRFLSLDPVRSPGVNGNYYLYADGDPLNRIDPTGEISLTLGTVLVAVGVGIAVGAAIGAGVEYFTQPKGQPTDWGQVGRAALIGGALGGIGAAVGVVAGAALVGTLGVLGAGAAAGGLGAAAEFCVEAAGKGTWDWGEFGKSVAMGAAIGAVTAGIGGIFGRRAAQAAARRAEQEAAKKLEQEAAKKLEQEAAKKLEQEAAKKLEQEAAKKAAEEAAKKSPATLSKAGQAPDKGGLSKAGRSLAKHAAGKRTGSSKFPPAKGSPDQINQQGQAVLDDILNDPASVTKTRPGKGGEEILQVSKPDGTGVIYKKNGDNWEFSHFAENLY